MSQAHFCGKLSASAQETGKSDGPTPSELAERIKALRSANKIEVAPQRARKYHSTTEEAIAARIRRRVSSEEDSDDSAKAGGRRYHI